VRSEFKEDAVSDHGQVYADHWALDAIAIQFRIAPRQPGEALDGFVTRLITGLREKNILNRIEDALHDILFAIEQSQQPAAA